MPADFTALTAEVEREKTVGESAIALLNGFQTRLDEAIAADNLSDNTATAALAQSLRAQTDALAAAVAANTPAA